MVLTFDLENLLPLATHIGVKCHWNPSTISRYAKIRVNGQRTDERTDRRTEDPENIMPLAAYSWRRRHKNYSMCLQKHFATEANFGRLCPMAHLMRSGRSSFVVRSTQPV